MKPLPARCDILPSAFERYETIYKTFISNTDIYGIPKRTEKRTEKIKSIKVHVATCENYPSENMKEGYAIRILNNTISLNAHAEWGILRGLGSGLKLVAILILTLKTDTLKIIPRIFLEEKCRFYTINI